MGSNKEGQSCPSSGELADKTGLPENAIASLREVFMSHPGIQGATLYGSRAMGTFRNSSDIDLTLHGEELKWQEFLEIERQIDDLLLPWKVDLSIFHQIDNPDLRDHIERAGVCFWRR